MHLVRPKAIAIASLGSLAILLAASRAFADPVSDRQMAQSLFDQARELMAKNDYVRACPMLAESQRIDPGGGTLLNLALCYEGEGKLAKAHLELNDALAQALRDGRNDRAALARERLAALTPRVPTLSLLAPVEPVPGMVVELDGVTVGSAAMGLSVQVDPGPHEIRLSAPGYVAWEWKETFRERDAHRVQLPKLASDGTAALTPPDSSATPSPKTKVATASWVLGGVGLGALVVSGITGLVALDANATFESRCNIERDFCPAGSSGADAASRASDYAWVSTGFLIGAIGLGVAAVLWPRTVAVPTPREGRSQPFMLAF